MEPHELPILPQENANRPCVARVSVSEALHRLLVTTDDLILNVKVTVNLEGKKITEHHVTGYKMYGGGEIPEPEP